MGKEKEQGEILYPAPEGLTTYDPEASAEASAVTLRDQEPSPGSLVAMAIKGQVSIEVIERLVELKEREEARKAEMAMARALAAFQAECPPIPRTKSVSYDRGGTKKPTFMFAPLESIVPIIRPLLTKHGLSFVHDTKVTGQNPNQEIAVVCVLQHIDGAMRSATFAGPIDSSGGKNPIQQVASARSYGRRYTLMDVLGLTTDEDTDGNAVGADQERVGEDQLDAIWKLLVAVGADAKKFCAYMGVPSLGDIPAARYQEAMNALEAKRQR